MINSRSLDNLLPVVREKAKRFLDACSRDEWLVRNGITVLVISTERDHESQAVLYAQGRSKPGKIVTNAKPGYSWHNWRCALDVLPLRHGKEVWGTRGPGKNEDATDDYSNDLEVWQRIGEIGEGVGLEWGGHWQSFKDYPHFQYTGGLTLAQMRAGEGVF
ncbi:MAG: M15 family metallopeptidase [Pseudomonadota bacterium]